MLKDLLAKPHDQRDEEWVDAFVKDIVTTKIKLLSDDPQQGPDGFPYMMVETTGSDEPFLNLVKWGADKGVGIAINPGKEFPDFVFTYGTLLNYVMRGEFYTDEVPQGARGKITVAAKQTVYVGTPTEAFWPQKARAIFKEFLLQQGILMPKFVMISEEEKGPMDIAFSLDSLGNPDEAEWDGLLEAFSWFFPGHYSLALLSEKNLSGVDFFTL